MSDYSDIPKELALCKQWTHSISEEELKRPKHTHYHTEGSLSMVQAWDKAGETKYIGFYTTPKDAYIMGDIDHIENPEELSSLPIGLADLLQNHGAYSEVSPSGKGIRFILKLADADLKQDMIGNTFYTREPLANKREAQINVGPPWMTITGNTTSYSSGTIGEVSIETLNQSFKVKFKTDEVEKVECDVTPERLPNLSEVLLALRCIPLDKNPRVVRAYEKTFSETYSHYTFWLKMIMAVHDYAVKANKDIICLDEIIKWSAKDTDSYTGEEAVIAKWESLSIKETIVSYHTLFSIAYDNVIRWPKPKAPTKAQKAAGLTTSQPLNTEFVNFQELLKFFDVDIYRDVHSSVKYYLTGDSDIINQYFLFMGGQLYLGKYVGVFNEKTLTAALHILCQEKGFVGISHTQVIQFIRNSVYQSVNVLDIVLEYFETPFDELPEEFRENSQFYSISTAKYLFSALEIDYMTNNPQKEYDLYETYYISWLMGMVRNLFFRDSFHMNNCVLLLTGPEQIRKTSHFRFMLPQFMRQEYIAFTTHGFKNENSMRDVVKLSAENLLVVWDEVEQYLNRDSESNFKKIIDNTPQKFIDKYEVIASEVIPMAMYGATSNKREFNLSDTGSRRIYHIPVKWVDTDKLNKVCWHKVINELRMELETADERKPPWLLTNQQLSYQSQLHQKITNKTGMEFVLSEMFEWETPSCIRFGKLSKGNTNPRSSIYCLTFAKLKRMLANEIGHIPNQTEQIALKRSMVRMCSLYTRTERDPKKLTAPRGTVTNGQIIYNGCSYFITPKVKLIEED